VKLKSPSDSSYAVTIVSMPLYLSISPGLARGLHVLANRLLRLRCGCVFMLSVSRGFRERMRVVIERRPSSSWACSLVFVGWVVVWIATREKSRVFETPVGPGLMLWKCRRD
jgi:hypothetical protein